MVATGRSLLYHPDSDGHHIFDLNLASIIVSTILVSLRLFVRKFVVKALGWDDLIATVAWALSVALSALEMDTTHYGTGAQIEDVPRETLLQFFKRLTIMELIYLLASGAVRLAILAFLPRLSKNKVYTWSIYGLSTIVVVISLTGFFFVLTECSQIPIDSLLTQWPSDVFNYGGSWRQCRDKREERSMMLAHAIICIFVDFMLLVLPLWVVTNYLKMGVRAVQILLVFSLGIFAVVTGVVRFSIIVTTNFNVNTTYKMLPVAAWTDAELHVGLWMDTTISTTTPNRKSVMNRWSRSSGYFWSERTGSQPKEGGEGHVDAERSRADGVEMVDLEKGEDSGRVREQKDIFVDVDLGNRPNAREEAEASS
ncbi:integral membrane protein [Colletotrichum incanum]|nr:integral membrane protein [Colletotrichum incanum]